MTANDNEKVLHELGAHQRMTVKQCLDMITRNPPKDILILGSTKDGEFVSYSSKMTIKDAFWLLEIAQENIRRLM